MRIKKIFSLDKAIKLKEMGNDVFFKETNKKYPQFKVFCVIETDKLLRDFEKIRNK